MGTLRNCGMWDPWFATKIWSAPLEIVVCDAPKVLAF